MPHVTGAPVVVPQIVGRHDPERANRCERSDLRSAQPIILLVRVNVDSLTFHAAGQVELAGEDLPRIR
jgi:hypothetical protein